MIAIGYTKLTPDWLHNVGLLLVERVFTWLTGGRTADLMKFPTLIGSHTL
jgi:hypothetical protein